MLTLVQGVAEAQTPGHYDIEIFALQQSVDDCEVPVLVEGVSVVTVSATTASVEIIFDQGIGSSSVASIEVVDDQGNIYTATYTGYNTYRIYNAPIGVRLTISASSEPNCTSYPVSTRVDVECDGGSIAIVRPELLAALENWFQLSEENQVRLGPFLNGENSDLSYHERWAIYQRWVMDCEPVPPGMIDDSIPVGFSGDDRDDLCNCITLGVPVNAQPTLEAGTTWLPNYTESPHVAPGDNAEFWSWQANQGPARWHNIYATGWKSGYGEMYVNEFGDGETDVRTAAAGIRILLVCRGQEGYPDDCGCERPAVFNYEYNSNVLLRANLLGETNTRRAGAYVQDMVVVGSTVQGGPAEMFAADVSRRRAECNLSIDLEEISENLADAVDGLLPIITAVAGQSAPTSSQISDGIDGISGLFEDPVWEQNEGCVQDYSGPAINIAGSEDVMFEVGRTKTLYISTLENLRAQGMRKWMSWAGIVSDFKFSVYIPDQTEDHFDYCCSPFVYAYGLGGIYGSPVPEANHQTWIQSELNSYLPNSGHVVDDNKGTISEPSDNASCNDVVVQSLKLAPVAYSEIYTQAGKIVMTTLSMDETIDLNDGVYLLVEKSQEGNVIASSKLVIFHGQVLTSYN